MGSEKVETFDVFELYAELEKRKASSQKVALLLGSHTGAIFRHQSPDFRDLMLLYSKRDINSMDSFSRFSEYFNVLKEIKIKNGRRDIKITLDKMLNDAKDSRGDRALGKLINEELFSAVVTSNMDDVLEHACRSAGLKPNNNYVLFSSGLHVPEALNQFLHNHEWPHACKIFKIWSDTSTFSYDMDKGSILYKTKQALSDIFNQLDIGCFVVVGWDPVWDEFFVEPLINRQATIYFVNERADAHDLFFKSMAQYVTCKYLVGNYNKFFRLLHVLSDPDTLETLEVFITRLTQMNSDVEQIKAEQKNLYSELRSFRQAVEHHFMELKEMMRNLKE